MQWLQLKIFLKVLSGRAIICVVLLYFMNPIAFASISRLAVLGTQPIFIPPYRPNLDGEFQGTNTVNGSLWYDDEYNVFYNPAYINDFRQYVSFESGLEGGFLLSAFENFVYGVYVNRGGNLGPEGVSQAGLVSPGISLNEGLMGRPATGLPSSTLVPSFGDPNNGTKLPLDFFMGGDFGIKWGTHLAWAYKRDDAAGSSNGLTSVTAHYWHADLGIGFLGFEPFAGTTFSSNLGNENLEEINAGMKYKYENWTPYFIYHLYRESGLPALTATTYGPERTNKMSIIGVGVGYDRKLSESVNLLTMIGFYYNHAQLDDVADTNAPLGDYHQYILPLNVAVESDVSEWLTLRAGIGYYLWNEAKNINSLTNPSPSVSNHQQSLGAKAQFRIGTTLKINNFYLDSAFGTGTSSLDHNTHFDSNHASFDYQFFALISANYRW